MKIYKYQASTWNPRITVFEIEVEDKGGKTYQVNREVCGNLTWRSRINKNEIGVLNTDFGFEMFLLEPDDEKFRQAVKACMDMRIKDREDDIARMQEYASDILTGEVEEHK